MVIVRMLITSYLSVTKLVEWREGEKFYVKNDYISIALALTVVQQSIQLRVVVDTVTADIILQFAIGKNHQVK